MNNSIKVQQIRDYIEFIFDKRESPVYCDICGKHIKCGDGVLDKEGFAHLIEDGMSFISNRHIECDRRRDG